MTAQTETHTPPAGAVTETVTPVEAKQATDRPKGMPVVLGVSILGAILAMGAIFLFFLR